MFSFFSQKNITVFPYYRSIKRAHTYELNSTNIRSIQGMIESMLQVVNQSINDLIDCSRLVLRLT